MKYFVDINERSARDLWNKCILPHVEKCKVFIALLEDLYYEEGCGAYQERQIIEKRRLNDEPIHLVGVFLDPVPTVPNERSPHYFNDDLFLKGMCNTPTDPIETKRICPFRGTLLKEKVKLHRIRETIREVIATHANELRETCTGVADPNIQSDANAILPSRNPMKKSKSAPQGLETLRVAIVPTLWMTKSLAIETIFESELGASLASVGYPGIKVTVVPCTDYDDAQRRIEQSIDEDGAIHVAYLGPDALFSRQRGALPFRVIAARETAREGAKSQDRFYTSKIICSASHPRLGKLTQDAFANALNDDFAASLTIGFSDAKSRSGFIVPVESIGDQFGVQLHDWKAIRFFRSHDLSLLNVLMDDDSKEWRADLSPTIQERLKKLRDSGAQSPDLVAIDSCVLEAIADAYHFQDQVNVLWECDERMVQYPWVAHSCIPARFAKEIGTAIAMVRSSEVMKSFAGQFWSCNYNELKKAAGLS